MPQSVQKIVTRLGSLRLPRIVKRKEDYLNAVSEGMHTFVTNAGDKYWPAQPGDPQDKSGLCNCFLCMCVLCMFSVARL